MDVPQRNMSLCGGWRKESKKVSGRRHLRREIRESDSPANGLWGLPILEALQMHTFNLNKAFAHQFSLSFSEELFQAFSTFLRFPPVPPFSSSFSASNFAKNPWNHQISIPSASLSSWQQTGLHLTLLSPFPSCPMQLNPLGTLNDQLFPLSYEHWSLLFLLDYTWVFLFNRLIEILFIYHTIYSFKMSN